MKRNAILFATTADSAGNPTAVQRFGTTTIVGRLLDQLTSFGTTHVTVITRPTGEWALRGAVGERPDLRVVISEDVPGDLLAAAAAVGGSGTGHVVASADVVVHGEALTALLTEPDVASGALTATDVPSIGATFPVHARQGRVLSAGSPLHTVTAVTGAGLDLLFLDPSRSAALRAAVLSVAALPSVRSGEALGARPPASATLSMVLVALVRAGIPLADRPLGGYPWARPVGEAETLAARTRMDAVDEDELRLAAALGPPEDDLVTAFCVRPYAGHLLRWAGHRGLRSGQVTLGALAATVLAAAGFATGWRAGLVAGAVLLCLAFVLGRLDGMLARYTRRPSVDGGRLGAVVDGGRLGAVVDGGRLGAVVDGGREYVALACLAVGSARAGRPVWVPAACALLLGVAHHLLDGARGPSGDEAVQEPVQPSLDVRADRTPGTDPDVPPTPLSAQVPTTWGTRLAAFGPGERCAVLALTAAFLDARAAVVAFLALGTLSLAHRLFRRIARIPARSPRP